MTTEHPVRNADTTESRYRSTPRFEQPLSDDEVWTMLQTAANSDRIMPIVKGNWQQSARDYDSAERAARALVFDLSFYTNYRFSQVRRLFRQTGMRDVLTDVEIDDIVEAAYFEQGGRSYPTFE
ncbi:hypothetical protein [Halorussus ruber]|uniref:hypothetical protein n=1 Tax=Halorussus ruber TaxID=1126238 RepID=UPI001092E276|nr:hypothetical protein [Halorussus ruber]